MIKIGAGKSDFCKAILQEVKDVATLFFVTSDIFVAKFPGESEKLLTKLFDVAYEKSPSVVVIGKN